ncbi:MAG: hypothetical protein ABJC12_05850, partial [Saprospiraceae bacterium]
AGGCPGAYLYSRTWTATDICGNTSTATQFITVADLTAPVITGGIFPSFVQGCSLASTPPPVTTVAALEALGVAITDACSPDASLIVTSTDVSSGICPIAITRTYRVADACGNSSSAMCMITIVDSTPPTGPASIQGSTGNNICIGGALATFPFITSAVLPYYTDNCTTNLTATLTGTLLIGDNCLWILTYTFKVTDACGNALTNRKITYTGNDQTAPTGTPPVPSVGNPGCKSTAAATYPFNASTALAGYSDNCGSPVIAVLTGTQVAGTDCSWGIVYTFRVEDQCGNSLQSQQMVITGGDVTPPTFTRPANVTIFTSSPCVYNSGVAFTGDVTNEADNCASGLNATFTDNIVDGACECSKIITRTWSLVDACGNAAANQVQTINVYSNFVTNTNDSGPGSLRSVIACVPEGSTINFDPALMDQTITLTSGEILINKNLTLAGLGMLHLTVSGNLTSRVFHVTVGKSLNVKNMMLKDGSWTTNGGAICAEGNLTLENVMLKHNFENGQPKAMTVLPPAGATIVGTVEIKN